MIPSSIDPARASRLLKVFRDVTKGGKAISTAGEARLFLEAVRTNASPAACLEIITATEVARNAISNSIRIDSSISFIRAHVFPFIVYFSDPGVKMVYGGQLLHQVLLLIAHPPVLWGNLLNAFRESQLTEDELQVFAWLCLELASLPDSALDNIVKEMSIALSQKQFQEARNHGTRELIYRIRKVLALRLASSGDENLEAAGGRHDNDFSNFRDVSIFPTSDEFYSNAKPFYRTAAEVATADHLQRPRFHLDNQFRLLREDMLGELRDDLKVAIGRKKSKKRAQIFSGLLPIEIDTGDERRSHACAVSLTCFGGLEFMKKLSSTKCKAFFDDNRNFLRHQSFGALCGEDHIVAFAFLLRDVDQLLKKPPVITLQFTSSEATARALQALKPSNNLKFILVDTPVFAYQPVLECLREITELPLGESLLRLPTDETNRPQGSLQQSSYVQEYVRRLEKLLKEESRSLSLGMQTFRLDDSQVQSLLHALQSPVTLIQGPPGTGKSFVGALAAKILLGDPEKRILVLSYTNHALDQFLEDLMEIGISSGDMVRLGSKSTDATSGLSLEKQLRSYAYRRNNATWEHINGMKTEMYEVRIEIEAACALLVRDKVGSLEVLNFLEFSDDDQTFYEAFLLPEQERGFQLVGKDKGVMGPDYLLGRWITGQDAGELWHFVSSESQDIWHLSKTQRSVHVQRWVDCIRKERIESVQNLIKRFDEAQEQVERIFSESKSSFMQTKKIIGCTTTAAAMYKSLIKAAKPDVVLVEEAGEILEAHVLTALHSDTKQLILIGDHKQLRPKINNYALSVEKGDGFDLNRSLFERLILQGHDHVTLQKQHRMHPDISDLVRQMTYPDLLDSDKTKDRKPPKGFQGRVSFVNHSHPEDLASNIADRRDVGVVSSRSNLYEARMVLKLVKYFGQQGYGTENLVVLTPYLGQLRLLREILGSENDPLLNDLDSFELICAGLMTAAAGKVPDGSGSGRIRLSTIDNYQGEESDIVIASLTRSNNNGDIGFMKAPERLNVLCSRARECLILIGNMETFMASPHGKAVWLPFFSLMKEKNYLHDGFAIRCQKHPERTALLTEPDDFDTKCPDGGCDKACNATLSCNIHKCLRRCHRLSDHSKIRCHTRLAKHCDRGHEYSVDCNNQDQKCAVCFREDEDTRRRLKRDLQMEMKRNLAQNKYAQDLQKVDDDLDRERRLIKNEQEDQKRSKTLKEHMEELKALQQTRVRAEAMKANREPPKSVPGAFPDGRKPTASPVLKAGSAEEEWQNLKTKFEASSNAMDQLMKMIGLESIKENFLSIKSKVDTAVRQGISLSTERFGCSLLGNPGTGKTTVARIYAKFLVSVGVIAGSRFEERSGSKLASLGVPGCQKLLDDVLNDGGGVIFIDEAYQLSSGNNPGGRAVLDFLLAEVENYTGKIVFVLAGYSKQMESFFAHNPGFPSRFPITMKFEDYDGDELLKILQYQMDKKYGGRMKWEDDLHLRIACSRLGRGRGKEGFGNARAVENLLSNVSSRQANRIRKVRRGGASPDDLLFTMEDLVGPEPSVALGHSKAWIELQKLIGLGSVKESVRALIESTQTNYVRELAEEPIIEYSLNKVFLGSPGTGKTTVAKLYAQILVDLGLLSNGEVIVKNPADFVGAVLGASEAQTKGILASTVGKVLVIDEAYGLYGGSSSSGGSSDPYKTAVVDSIVAEVQSVPGEDRCVLLLGYKDQMEEMFQNVNPGLSRRFPLSSAFVFEDFDKAEMQRILDLKLKLQGFSATDQAKQVASDMLERARNRPNFGNAGEVDILLNDAKARHQRRLTAKESHQVSTLEALDFDQDFNRAERNETNVAKLFEGTVGCEKIVATLEGYQETVRSMKALDMDPKESIPFNFLFRGPPGTGKTSTARKMGKVFYDMGFLAKAEVIDCSASDLIGQYVGQTGPKVQQLLDKALGKVLFVEEAYRLAEGQFAKEAIDEVVDSVTKDKYKNRLVIILAGYDEDINRLLSVNPGMSSRFPEVIDFHSLSSESCYELLLQLLLKKKRFLDSKKASNNLDLACLSNPSSDFQREVIGIFHALTATVGWASARDVESLANSILSIAIKSCRDGQVMIDEDLVKKEFLRMLDERESRGQQAGTIRGMPKLEQLFQQMPPPPQTRSMRTVAHEQTTAEATDEEAEPTPPESPVAEVSDGSWKATRDAGVSDEVWEQLEKDKKAQEEKNTKYRDMLEKKRRAVGAAREAILKELIEEEERRKKEEEQRKKAAMMGRCPMNFAWIKQSAGFRCAGGSHFISDEEIICT
ncbi:ATPase [Colletotrichum phormii]|uniref:ATPase n=1 Tax=Colletotrichum phormii TaxID=359342 RepID=A0AAI9ZFR6_9PEZI|nr:ATPase [Colletotrichum phormii]KAK1622780.1 ATPase [Colletotrichum phormii]